MQWQWGDCHVANQPKCLLFVSLLLHTHKQQIATRLAYGSYYTIPRADILPQDEYEAEKVHGVGSDQGFP